MSTKYDMAANSLIINKLTYAQYKAGRADGSISDDQVNNEIFDITDINTAALPADGGNADTIDNLDSSSFIRSDSDDSVSGYITFNNGVTINGDLTVSGTNTVINTTTVSTTDNLIQLATDNTVALLGYAGIYVNKYDGTHTGALVFDATGTAYVGDVTDNGDGTISAISGDSSSSSLQPLATRNKVIADGSLLQ